MNLLSEARRYAQLGWSIIPVHGKKGRTDWKPFQTRRPTDAELVRMFSRRHTGLAVICGPVSGDLICRDFDQADAYHRWAKTHQDLAAALPTAKTLRGFHVYARCFNAEGLKQLGDGELRASRGICVLPPSLHPDAPIVYTWIIEPSPHIVTIDSPLSVGWTESNTNGVCTKGKRLVLDREQRNTLHTYCSLSTIEESIRATLPTGPGERNPRIFELAWCLRRITPPLDQDALQAIVRDWHARALPVIKTKDFEATWNDFAYAYPRLYPPKNTFQSVLAALPDHPEPRSRLTALCQELQSETGDQPFFLSCRKAGQVIGVSRERAHQLLQELVAAGTLEVAVRGNYRTMQATRYYYTGNGKAGTNSQANCLARPVN